MLFIDLLVQGLVQGSIYALIALGLTMVYGLLRILHVAHAAFFTLGGYMAVTISNASGSLFLAIFAGMIVAGIGGVLIYQVIYRPILDRPPYIALISSIAVFIASEELFRIVFGPYGLTFATPVMQGRVDIGGGIILQEAEIAVACIAFAALAAFGWITTKTRMGIGWRATVSDPSIASVFGVNPEHVRMLNFFLGSSFAALSGSMVAVLNNIVEPTMGNVTSYKALAIIVLGGLGSTKGTLVAALLLGVIEAYGTIYFGSFMDRDSIAFAFLVAILMLRPRGLFGKVI